MSAAAEQSTRPELPVLVSPTAGDGNPNRAQSLLEPLLLPSVRPRFLHPASLDDLARLSREIVRSGATSLAVAGGDGMLHHVVNAVRDAPLVVGPIPLGSGNDFCRGTGLTTDPAAAAGALVSGETQRVDLIELNGIRVCTVAGLGLVADAGVQVGRLLAPGSPWRAVGRALGDLSYLSAAGIRLLLYPRIIGTARVWWRDPDGLVHEERRRLYGILIANLQTLGAGLKLPVPARYDDGVFEIVLVNARSRLLLARSLSCLRSDRPVPPGTIDVLRAVDARIEWDGGSRVLGDGEDLGTATTFEIRTLRASLAVPRLVSR